MLSKYFGLQEEPFGATPDPRWLYRSAKHRQALASLREGYYSNRGFTALIGPPGLGKTTLLFQFLHDIRGSARIVFLFDTQCEPLGLLRYILRDLGVVPAISGDEMHLQLESVLVNEARAERTVVVVVDEAQNLTCEALEMLRLLTNYETPRAKMLHIVLSGQPALGDTLLKPSMEQLRQRVSNNCWLEPFSVEETTAYIRHRLEQAGYRGAPLFRKDALRRIMLASHGIPRLINNLCFNALELCREQKCKQVDMRMAAEAIAIQELDPEEKKKITDRWLASDEASRRLEQALQPQKQIETARLFQPLPAPPIRPEQSTQSKYVLLPAKPIPPELLLRPEKPIQTARLLQPEVLVRPEKPVQPEIRVEQQPQPAQPIRLEQRPEPELRAEQIAQPAQAHQAESGAEQPLQLAQSLQAEQPLPAAQQLESEQPAQPEIIAQTEALEPFEAHEAAVADGPIEGDESIEDDELAAAEERKLIFRRLIVPAAAVLLVASGIGLASLFAHRQTASGQFSFMPSPETAVLSASRLEPSQPDASTSLVAAPSSANSPLNGGSLSASNPGNASVGWTAAAEPVVKNKPSPARISSGSIPAPANIFKGPVSAPASQPGPSLASASVPTPAPAANKDGTSFAESGSKNAPFEVTAGRNQSLRDICVRFLGVWDQKRLHEIRALNPNLADLDHIQAGEKIWLPAPEPAPISQPFAGQAHGGQAPGGANLTKSAITAAIPSPAGSVGSAAKMPNEKEVVATGIGGIGSAGAAGTNAKLKGNVAPASLPPVAGTAHAGSYGKVASADILSSVKETTPSKRAATPGTSDVLSSAGERTNPADQ
jgi:general secretion pathway protein A